MTTTILYAIYVVTKRLLCPRNEIDLRLLRSQLDLIMNEHIIRNLLPYNLITFQKLF